MRISSTEIFVFFRTILTLLSSLYSDNVDDDEKYFGGKETVNSIISIINKFV